MNVIDADAHVEESEAIFKFLDKEVYARIPLALGLDTDTVYGKFNAVWLIDGQTYPKMYGRGGVIFATPTSMKAANEKTVGIPAQQLTDAEARLSDLDKLRIDTPTLFLTTTAEDVELEAAMLRDNNSFMADSCSKARGRLAVVALCHTPTQTKRADLKGPCGIFPGGESFCRL